MCHRRKCFTQSIDNKTFVLDSHITLNNHTHINLEMQVENELNWADRSLSYMCRTFDQLYRGEEYTNTSPVIHIGFLNFSLFPESSEFYATYKMLNIKTHQVFSDKLTLGVVDLTHIDHATEEDKVYQIDRWAKLFKAGTWEEIMNLAKGDECMAEAVKELYKYNADELIMQQCRAREEYYQRQRTLHKAIKDANAEKAQAVAEKAQAVAEKAQALETIQVKDQLIAELQKQLVEMQEQLGEMKEQLAQNQKESDDGKK
ncbi:MAG: Rpn family recombination-promoting nuclease/putative transposase [Lachnospiraceae bacterium]